MNRKGFTLIEILIVISVLALIFSITLPTLSTFSAELSLEASTKAVASELRNLQSRAILQHKTLSLDLSKLKLPLGVKNINACNLSFSSSGFPPPGGSGTVILQNKFGRTRKVILSSAGRVRIE